MKGSYFFSFPFLLPASIGCQLGPFSLPPFFFIFFSTILSIKGVLQFYEWYPYRGRSYPSRLLVLVLGGKIDNRDLVLGRADHFVGVGAVSAQEIRVVHFGLDGEAEVGGQGAGLDEGFCVYRTFSIVWT